MGLDYHLPPGVYATNIQGRPALTTPQGGKIILDRRMLDLWQRAQRQDVDAILAPSQSDHKKQALVCAALACLAEAGLLVCQANQPPGSPNAPPEVRRAGILPAASGSAATRNPHAPPLVSVVIVSYNSQKWLENCIPSLLRQTYPAIEIIVVDNGCMDGTADWLKRRYAGQARLVTLEQPRSLACAINRGVQVAQGDYFLLVNPDTLLIPDVVACMVSEIQGAQANNTLPEVLEAPESKPPAAVAAKLRLLWAPAFLNGLGNYVGAISWGADSALGHLDLGQFDCWEELPSACFAAALIPASAWRHIGPLDENFPLYYEDSEWCYRARLMGYSVRAAPGAVVYHAFSGGAPAGLKPARLRQVAYGRLRFITKILGFPAWFRFMIKYTLEDCIRFLYALLRGRWSTLTAYGFAWSDYIASLGDLWQQRKNIRARRKISDQELLDLQRHIPYPLMWKGFPQLTWDIVCSHYAPWMAELQQNPPGRRLFWRRAVQIWQIEGPSALIYHVLKQIQWRLAAP